MKDKIVLTPEEIERFCDELRSLERSDGTVEQYRSSMLRLWRFLPEDKTLSRESLLRWKKSMSGQLSVRTVNCKIAAVNSFLKFRDRTDLKLNTMRCQRRLFSEDEMSREELHSLLRQAQHSGDEQLAMLMYAISASGIRVSEVRALTVEAIRQRSAVISLKGKTRYIPLSSRLCSRLQEYAAAHHIHSGPVFLDGNGRVLDRRRIWERMKKMCIQAGIDPKKGHPHALRHLFARNFYDFTRDIVKLSDLLGHSNIETTRIYVATSGEEHRSILDQMTALLEESACPEIMQPALDKRGVL